MRAALAAPGQPRVESRAAPRVAPKAGPDPRRLAIITPALLPFSLRDSPHAPRRQRRLTLKYAEIGDGTSFNILDFFSLSLETTRDHASRAFVGVSSLLEKHARARKRTDARRL